MWNTDILEILDILTRLGYRDDRMNEATDMVKSKQGENSRWQQENRFDGRFATPFDRNGTESKWVTLNAIKDARGTAQMIPFELPAPGGEGK